MRTVESSISIGLTRASGEDLDDVMQVMAAAFEPSFGEAWTRAQCAGILPMSGVELTLAKHEGKAVGFALTRQVAAEAELLLLAVHPDGRGRGVGSALLTQFIRQGREAGLHRLHLEVRESNPAVSLYSRHLFIVEGRRPKYYRGADGQFHDALTMARSIVSNTAG
ncbi:ribosomal protein S18-alanine N-acetyltransferase [Sphingomonas arenae]|uniref:ribosomal protein S18-alanine N-acetyltransferase n=1 Tax=Sphingomonas arenae TaxID=2812555 RepID=UPI001967906A|nr:ribosomal protein S18-alanine N-acetyltransferase [Sphingomonas arenae]